MSGRGLARLSTFLHPLFFLPTNGGKRAGGREAVTSVVLHKFVFEHFSPQVTFLYANTVDTPCAGRMIRAEQTGMAFALCERKNV